MINNNKNIVQQVINQYSIRHIVARKMYNIKFTLTIETKNNTTSYVIILIIRVHLTSTWLILTLL